MNTITLILIIYFTIGFLYAMYNFIRKMDSWKKIPFNIIVGPFFIVYVIYTVITKRRMEIG